MAVCPCCSGVEFSQCCEPFLAGSRLPETAEQTMRSRYMAYTRGDVPYLMGTLHPDCREQSDEEAARRWSEESDWLGLEILQTEAGGPGDSEGLVEFVARFRARNGEIQTHREISRFVKQDGRWLFREGHTPPASTVHRPASKVGRNDPCPCGSGKKYKKCCEGAAA